ncbi:MAG: formate dehydrogenase subunit gamma [Dehalococcoidales bacterium]|nr:formate dehydrogenase subunit gamma [Dehalococcoidales bacterium]
MDEIERYRKPTRVLHWAIAVSFVALFLTGLVLFVPALGFLARDSWTRVFHRIMAVIFVAAPLAYLLLNWKASWKGVSEAFNWGVEDLGWLQAAPRYYFLSDESSMPPQGHMNSGQKLWWLMVIVFGLVFTASGIIMWAFKATAGAELLQWMVVLHDVAFIATGSMFFVHVYLSVFHPLMAGALDSMVRGKVTARYAKAHHARWYAEAVNSEDAAWRRELIVR